jgi:hypothetical protein
MLSRNDRMCSKRFNAWTTFTTVFTSLVTRHCHRDPIRMNQIPQTIPSSATGPKSTIKMVWSHLNSQTKTRTHCFDRSFKKRIVLKPFVWDATALRAIKWRSTPRPRRRTLRIRHMTTHGLSQCTASEHCITSPLLTESFTLSTGLNVWSAKRQQFCITRLMAGQWQCQNAGNECHLYRRRVWRNSVFLDGILLSQSCKTPLWDQINVIQPFSILSAHFQLFFNVSIVNVDYSNWI